MNEDIRWKQRFENYSNCFKGLERSLEVTEPSEVERCGIIQFFELTYELAWKLIRDYLYCEGFAVNSPKEAIRQGFQAGVIKDGHTWMELLADRNLTVHTYNEQTAIIVEQKIRDNYYPLLKQLYVYFEEII